MQQQLNARSHGFYRLPPPSWHRGATFAKKACMAEACTRIWTTLEPRNRSGGHEFELSLYPQQPASSATCSNLGMIGARQVLLYKVSEWIV